jgi:hypothetical protein
LKIPFQVDRYNQTYNLNNKNRPLLAAHCDQIEHKQLTKITIKNGIISGNSNLGADDKNGIWIILNLLKKYSDINFIFSNNEETCNGDIKHLLSDENTCNIPFALVFDRKGSSDIIGYKNDYCTKQFEKDITKIGYGFKPAIGAFSDCDEISNYLSCVNISCGYYNAHQKTEYTIISELLNTLQFAQAIIENITGFYDAPVKEPKNWYKKTDDFMDDDSICPNCFRIMDKDDIGYYCLECGVMIDFTNDEKGI